MSSIWDSLTGRKSQSQNSSPSSSSPQTSPSGDSSSSSPPHAPTNVFDASSPPGQGVNSFLGSSAFADPSQLHPLAGLDQEALQYITLEDSVLSDLPGGQSVLPSRGWSDDLCYGTGITYLSALGLGGAWGLREGLGRSAGQPPKLRLNSVLNAVTRRGPFLGNSAGVVAIIYNLINSYVGHLRGQHDAANSIFSGFLSGALFKSTRGVRSAATSGLVVGSVAGVWAIARKTFSSSAEQREVHI